MSVVASRVPVMIGRWTAEQVLALAPDASSVAAGRRLATSGPWSSAGACAEPAAVWGECKGSGKVPYRAAVDLTGPAFSCSCPSRKIPCKHVLALLLLWSSGAVTDADQADWVTSWLASRAERAARAAARSARAAERSTDDGAPPGPADPEAALRRAAQRERRMCEGLAELEQWLRDQARSGLAGADRAGYAPFDTLAARMIDAQLPAVAAAVGQFAATAVSGEGWPGRLLQEYALLHLLARVGPGALTGPDAGLAATVRAHLGVPVPKEDVLASAGLRDHWRVLGHRDDVEERLTVRRVWVRGQGSGRLAVVMSFAVAGQPLDTSLVPGTLLDADLHFHPGAVAVRALVGDRHALAEPASGGVPGCGLDDALAGWASALAADPWLRAWPVVLAGVVPVVDGDDWWLVDDAGALPLVDVGETGWVLLAASGGHPVTLLSEIVPGGVRVVNVLPSVARHDPAVPGGVAGAVVA